MRLRTWLYLLKQGADNILSNRLVHTISVGTIAVSLILLGAFLLLLFNMNQWMQEWGQTLSVSVYLEDNIDEEARKAVRERLARLPGAEITAFISKEKAKQELMEALSHQVGLLEGLTRNPLPASFEVLFRDVVKNRVEPREVKQGLEKMTGVDEVQYSDQWLERFESIVAFFKMAGFITGGLLCVMVLFIIANTIKLTIYARREEIEIYKLVGATDWFVKVPFLVEGTIQGLLGGLVALMVLFTAYSLLSMKTVQLSGLPLIRLSFLPGRYAALLLFLSLFLGLLGSFITIGRFFRS
jgi:cell division transport system permease protein